MLELIALKIAVIVFVYACILTQPGEILYMLRVFLTKLDANRENWWWKITIGCEKCIAGQSAFWYYVFCNDSYNVFEHVYFVCLSIAITYTLKLLISKLI